MKLHIIMDETEEDVTPAKVGLVIAFAKEVLGDNLDLTPMEGDPDDLDDVVTSEMEWGARAEIIRDNQHDPDADHRVWDRFVEDLSTSA